MNNDSRTRSARKGEVLHLVAEALAPYLAPHLREFLHQHSANTPLYYSQIDTPLGRRRHLELVRRGLLPGKKVGRLVLVARDAVHAFIETHAPRTVDEQSDDVLEEWGLRSRGRQ